MFTILWIIIVAASITFGLVWLINNNGLVLITWLGYEIRVDVLTSILLASFFIILLLAISYLLARILAVRFPRFLRKLFKKSYVKSLEKIIHKNNQSFDIITELMLALEANDQKKTKKLSKKLFKSLKNEELEAFLRGKIAFQKQDFTKAIDYFAKIDDNNHAKLLFLKSKLQLALQKKDDVAAVAYTQQISSLKNDK